MLAIRALLAKELAQHGWALAALTVALALALLVLILGADVSERTLSRIQVVGTFVMVFVVVAAAVLGNRLVVGEYHARTQRFVECLPIRRHQPVLVKYLLGLVYLLAVSWAATFVVAALAARTEPVEPRFVFLLLARVTVFVCFVWGFAFAMGFTGRLRATLYLVIVAGALYLHATTTLDLMRDGPLGLLEAQTFAFERERLPVDDLVATGVLAGVGLVWAFALALLGDGSAAESLSRPMSQREKATTGLVLIGLLLGATTLAERMEKPPYRFTGANVLRAEHLPLSVLYLRDRYRADAEALLRRLEASFAALGEALGIAHYPPVRVSIAAALGPGVFQTAELDLEDGVLVRANYHRLDAPAREALDAYLVRALLARTTNDRARFEPKRWLHDGFSLWWALHGTTPAAPTPDWVLLRALVAAGEQGMEATRIARWVPTREALGEPYAEALAYSGLRVIEDLRGRDAVLALARAVLGRAPPRDARELVYEWRHPMARVFRDAVGIEWDDFLGRWAAWLAERREGALGTALAALPRVAGGVEPVAGVDGIRRLHYRFELTAPAAVTATCTLLHEALSPLDGEVAPARLHRVDAPCANGVTDGEIAGRYGPGEIALLLLEVELEGLRGAPVRVHAERLVMP